MIFLTSHLFSVGGFYTRVLNILRSLTVLFPTRIKIVPHEFADRTSYRKWLLESGFRENFPDRRAKDHTTSPFCWLSIPDSDVVMSDGAEQSSDPKAEDIDSFIGGHDDTLAWCRSFMAPCEQNEENAVEMEEDGYTAEHGYEYDLIVIGGGSGGMAVSVVALFGFLSSILSHGRCVFHRPPKRQLIWERK